MVVKNNFSKFTPVSDTLLTGVPEEESRVVCYGNLSKPELSTLEVGVSTLDDLIPRHYNVELLLQSDKDNMVHINDYSVRLELVPAGILAADGDACTDHVCNYVPNLETDIANYCCTSDFTLNRFDDEHGVMLVLFKMSISNARIPILPSLYDADPNDTEQVTLPIVISIAVDKLTVPILDWSTVIEQNENVGG